MFKEHGDFTLTRQGNVLIAYVSGAWNAETEKAYGAIIHDSIKPFNGGPWVLISNVEEWELCTPDCQKLMMQLAVECRSKGLKREAIVNSNIDSVKLDLFEGLTFETKYGLQYFNTVTNNVNNPFYGAISSAAGRLTQGSGTNTIQNLLNMLTYKKSFGNHNLDIILAHESNESLANSNSVTKERVVNLANGLKSLNNYILQPNPATGLETEGALESYFTRVNYGFDRKKMMIYLRNGIGNPANGGFIPIGLSGYNESIGFNYQPEKAKQLVEKFKKESGISNPEITLVTTSNYLSFCEFIQRELQKTGLTINVDVMPEATLRSARSNGKVDLFRGSWIADYLDAENYLSIFYSKNFTPNGSNYFHYKDVQFDSLYDKAFTITSIEERQHLYTTMDSLAMQKAIMVPLYYDEVIRFTSKNVKGLGINPINLLDLKRVRKN